MHRTERQIEDYLSDYPYLISPEFEEVERQVRLEKDQIADLVYKDDQRIVVIELKKDRANKRDVEQIVGYCKYYQGGPRKVSGILVARSIIESARTLLDKENTKNPFHMEFKAIGSDIPRDITVCEECGRARGVEEDCKTLGCN
ncbi:MAG: DUF91 domain-containing protein [Gammaproteobacteria bacterium]|nr:DUF91 domain-containing protein [Gammaproteobacteria bacterium]